MRWLFFCLFVLNTNLAEMTKGKKKNLVSLLCTKSFLFLVFIVFLNHNLDAEAVMLTKEQENQEIGRAHV